MSISFFMRNNLRSRFVGELQGNTFEYVPLIQEMFEVEEAEHLFGTGGSLGSDCAGEIEICILKPKLFDPRSDVQRTDFAAGNGSNQRDFDIPHSRVGTMSASLEDADPFDPPLRLLLKLSDTLLHGIERAGRNGNSVNRTDGASALLRMDQAYRDNLESRMGLLGESALDLFGRKRLSEFYFDDFVQSDNA
jgi:hypothetical protein